MHPPADCQAVAGVRQRAASWQNGDALCSFLECRRRQKKNWLRRWRLHCGLGRHCCFASARRQRFQRTCGRLGQHSNRDETQTVPEALVEAAAGCTAGALPGEAAGSVPAGDPAEASGERVSAAWAAAWEPGAPQTPQPKTALSEAASKARLVAEACSQTSLQRPLYLEVVSPWEVAGAGLVA